MEDLILFNNKLNMLIQLKQYAPTNNLVHNKFKNIYRINMIYSIT